MPCRILTVDQNISDFDDPIFQILQVIPAKEISVALNFGDFIFNSFGFSQLLFTGNDLLS